MGGTDDDTRGGTLRVLEFYSGLGGMRYSLVECGADAAVVEAFDLSEVANDVYLHNFNHRPTQGTVQRLSVAQLEGYGADVWLMSPPCQPYTRVGLRRDTDDGRAWSFLSMMDKLREMKQPPTHIFVENVVGFETSATHALLMACLGASNFAVQQYVLSPVQFGIPYSRPRFFCLAKRQPLQLRHVALNGCLLHHPTPLLVPHPHHRSSTPSLPHLDSDSTHDDVTTTAHTQGSPESDTCPVCAACSGGEESGGGDGGCRALQDFLVPHPDRVPLPHLYYPPSAPCPSGEDGKEGGGKVRREEVEEEEEDPWRLFRVPPSVRERWGESFDIVTPASVRCCCFTKSYVKYSKGTGSVLATQMLDEVRAFEEGSAGSCGCRCEGEGEGGEVEWRGVPLSRLGLRYFTPREVANFHSFPASFQFPDHVTLRQRYALVGNSLSVAVVAPLLRYLLT